ncbi:MAG: YqeG family HAD IIIA-type phosphatase [Spirulinaceae cyanobacterium]
MAWASNLQPDLVLEGPVIGITPDILQQYNLKGLILDVDETLVPIKIKQVSPDVALWIEETRKLAQIWLVSNNLSETRIGNIAKELDLPYLLAAKKPSRRKLKQAAQEMGLPVKQVAMVGDRLFTDVLAGNRQGMFTILVEPMVDPAIVARSYPIRSFEVWLSKALGVSLQQISKN